jgi:(2R)-ethylmalonyl-CoA mutase
MAPDPEAEKTALASVEAWKAERDQSEVDKALAQLAEDAKTDANLMAATLAAARAGATTGEWAGTLREVFGEFRAPTGVAGAVGALSSVGSAGSALAAVRQRVKATGEELRRPAAAARRQARPRRALQRRRAGRRPRPRRRLRGRLPGHPAHARADRARPRGRGRALRGLSILSGSHMELVPPCSTGSRAAWTDVR